MTKPLIKIENLGKNFGQTSILKHLNFEIYSGEFLTFLGPSGCGKTTLLRLLSGFETPSSGHIWMENQIINQVPPQKRHMHTVFQNYALFPHLNVYENVAFPLVCQKLSSAEIERRVKETLDLVQLDGYQNRLIKQLSGGQQQRVAIARAIINQPKVLLLDEPLSSLDYRLRKNMQIELKKLQKELNMTFIFVTHDQEEALSMSDRIIIFNQGKIEQIGTPFDIYEHPKNLHVAKFIGETNIFSITVQDIHSDFITTKIEGVSICCQRICNVFIGDSLHLLIRPEDIRVHHSRSELTLKDKICGRVLDVTYKGSTVDLLIELKSGQVISTTSFFDEDHANIDYQLNDSVWIEWPCGWEVLLPYEP